ncbi:MAG: helix-hairpin-helix domain-containing protein, partial [Clostridia bacterium]
EAIKFIPSHRILAINRGEKENFLKVKVEKPEEKILNYIERDIIKNDTQFTEMLKNTMQDSFKRLIEPSIDREIRSDLTEKAEDKAIKVFGKNSKQLLLGAPIKGKTVMGFDPAYRTGCKIAVIDETGKLLDYTTVYPTEPQNDVEGAKKELLKLIEKDKIDMIAIGNGTASRESEMFVSDIIKETDRDVHYVIVSEAGASVYSASKLATEEYPDINVSIRGAISIARRLQDPLAELVKIDPKAIGVGQYQHDVNQKKLAESLTGVVEDSVNKVGVDVNTATPSLLSYVSGINNTIAKNIVKYRDENGKLKNRKQLLKVPKLGKVAYEQCAGFLRIFDGDNPLEITAVHPESYEVTEKLLNSIGFNKDDLKDKEKLEKLRTKLKSININLMSKELDIGEMTLTDIIEELSKPGRDPREDMPKPILRNDVLKLEDLKEGMVLSGTVRNVIDFGAFVDIGVKHDGLVHISEMSDKFIKNPSEIVSVGDIVKVKVIKIDTERQKVGLSMKV